MVKVTVITHLISLPLLYILIKYYEIIGIGVYFALVSLIPVIIMLFYFNSVFPKNIRTQKSNINRYEIYRVFKPGITSLLAFLLNQLAILYIRKFIIDNFGTEQNGIYQSVLGLSFNLFALLYSFLSNYTLPQLSIHKSESSDNQNLITILNDTLKYLLLIIVPLLVITFSFRKFLIVILYSNSFGSAEKLLIYQLFGDVFRIFASLFSLWLFARFKIYTLIIIDLIFNLLLFLLPNLLITVKYDINIVPISYLTAALVQLILYYIVTKKSINFKFKPVNLKMIMFSFSIVLSTIIISQFNTNIGMVFSIPVLLLFAYLVIRFVEMKSFKETYVLSIKMIKDKILSFYKSD